MIYILFTEDALLEVELQEYSFQVEELQTELTKKTEQSTMCKDDFMWSFHLCLQF